MQIKRDPSLLIMTRVTLIGHSVSDVALPLAWSLETLVSFAVHGT